MLRDVRQMGQERAPRKWKSFVDRRHRRESKTGEVPPPSDWAVAHAAAKKYDLEAWFANGKKRFGSLWVYVKRL